MTNKYKINWVINNEIAISRAPLSGKNFEYLFSCGIRNIICLCSEIEVPYVHDKHNIFDFVRYELPDHKCNEIITHNQINVVLEIIDKLYKKKGAILIHCLAGVERSPIICMAWLIKRKNLSYINAYEYIKSVHPDTNPMTNQLEVIKKIKDFR